jgi:glycosyltransferase involved in cell wall biosynthesis
MNEEIEYEVLLTKHPLYDWGEEEFSNAVNDFKDTLDNCDFKLVVAMSVYNEEQFLESSVDNTIACISDIDGIHILDGAWKVGGDSPISTDRTPEIVDRLKEKYPNIQIVYESKDIWESEGDKRNYQLKRIEEIFGKSYIIVKDGDEFFKFTNGRDHIFLKIKLAQKYPAIGLINTYRYGGEKAGLGVRLIPSHTNLHYHTGKAMVLHDEKCNIMCDYNHDNFFVINNKCFTFEGMIYVNHWNIRESNRQWAKEEYLQKVYNGQEEPCNAFIKDNTM